MTLSSLSPRQLLTTKRQALQPRDVQEVEPSNGVDLPLAVFEFRPAGLRAVAGKRGSLGLREAGAGASSEDVGFSRALCVHPDTPRDMPHGSDYAGRQCAQAPGWLVASPRARALRWWPTGRTQRACVRASYGWGDSPSLGFLDFNLDRIRAGIARFAEKWEEPKRIKRTKPTSAAVRWGDQFAIEDDFRFSFCTTRNHGAIQSGGGSRAKNRDFHFLLSAPVPEARRIRGIHGKEYTQCV